MAVVVIMGLSALVHEAGHTLNMVFIGVLVADDLDMEKIKVTHLLWTS